MNENALVVRVSFAGTGVKTGLETITQAFRGAGLEVLSSSPRGIDLSGHKPDLERVFHADIDVRGMQASFTSTVHCDIIPSSVSYRVYFPRKVEYF